MDGRQAALSSPDRATDGIAFQIFSRNLSIYSKKTQREVVKVIKSDYAKCNKLTFVIRDENEKQKLIGGRVLMKKTCDADDEDEGHIRPEERVFLDLTASYIFSILRRLHKEQQVYYALDSNCVKMSLRLLGDRDNATKEKKLSIYNIETNRTNKRKLEDNVVVTLSNKIIKYHRLRLSNSKEVRNRLREKDKQETAEKIVRWHIEFGCKCNDSTRLDRVLGMLGGGVYTASVRSRAFLETREDDEKSPAKIIDIIHLVVKEKRLTNLQVATAMFKRNRKQYSF
ncbi:hypothetical protein O3P69_014286 [Scylla paramamosain]|uniref:Uncharacterized protein n=1 Tax=Scylla paramamosain TaxID=85552 RepID=A0AAW0TAE3_SCYPA